MHSCYDDTLAWCKGNLLSVSLLWGRWWFHLARTKLPRQNSQREFALHRQKERKVVREFGFWVAGESEFGQGTAK